MKLAKRNENIIIKVIDSCLQRPEGMTTQNIMERCNRELLLHFEEPITASNTIRKYRDMISSNHHVVIETIAKGRKKYYRYKQRNFSIYNIPLSEEEQVDLYSMLYSVSQFAGRPQLEWLNGMLNKFMVTAAANDAKAIVSFDSNPDLKGQEFVKLAFDAIRKKQPVRILYKNFKGTVHDDVVHPYFLKEYNNRWFLFVHNDRVNKLNTYALDRIESFELALDVEYRPNADYNFSEIFDNVVGVTEPKPNQKIQDVILKVDKETYPRIKTKPIHWSQTELHEQEDENHVVIGLKVYLTPELTNVIGSYFEAIEVLAPKKLRKEFSRKIALLSEKYLYR